MAESAPDFMQAELGQTRQIYHLDSLEAYRDLAARLAEQASRSLDLLTPDLEPPVYDQAAFLEALKRLALKSRIARIRILLLDNGLVRSQGHRLIDLAQRLTSTIEIRRPGKQHADFAESFLLADDCGYLHRQLADRYVATASFNNRLQTSQLEDLFTEIWERGAPDRDLIRLHL